MYGIQGSTWSLSHCHEAAVNGLQCLIPVLQSKFYFGHWKYKLKRLYRKDSTDFSPWLIRSICGALHTGQFISDVEMYAERNSLNYYVANDSVYLDNPNISRNIKYLKRHKRSAPSFQSRWYHALLCFDIFSLQYICSRMLLLEEQKRNDCIQRFWHVCADMICLEDSLFWSVF